MESTGRFTPELRRLVYASYDECRRCGTKLEKETAALAGYDSSGTPVYVGPCCEEHLTERASHIYWFWHADRRCAGDQPLWRYMDFAKFIALLDDNALYFARADKLGDPFEGASGITERQSVWDAHYLNFFREAISTAPGRLTPPNEEELERESKRLLGEMRMSSERERMRTFASCWHANAVESEALWRLYCPPSTMGVVIHTTAEALQRSFNSSLNIELGTVQYLDFKKSFASPYERIFSKRKSLSHEAEVRAVIKGDRVGDAPVGQFVDVDLATLIAAVVPSPFSPPWFTDLVGKTLQRFGLPIQVRSSELLAEPFF